MRQTEAINPRILAWARETAGLTVEEAADKLALGSSERATAASKLSALEAGDRSPTSAQLLKAAALYKRPLITFYMPEPPQRGDRGEDFRTAPGEVSKRANGLLDALLRDVKARQQMVRNVLEEEDEAARLIHVGSASMEQGPATVAGSIRTALGIATEQQKAAKGPDGLFSLLRAAAERIGVFVLLLSDTGSHHSAISEEVFRGFAIADEIAPFIVINDRDARTARSFTLIHELTHIWLGQTGVSGPVRDTPANAIERFCNDVAGEFLLPSSALDDLSQLRGMDVPSALRATERVSQAWNVSQALVTYRLARKQWVSAAVAGEIFRLLAERWRNERERSRDAQSDTGGPSYYVVKRSRLGEALMHVVRRGLQGEVLTHTRAAKILGVKPASVEPLLRGPAMVE
jgi:Zn-dependent peptidase ImmA (M78 family)/transcriptional regulator with XRE-family HTH domain